MDYKYLKYKLKYNNLKGGLINPSRVGKVLKTIKIIFKNKRYII